MRFWHWGVVFWIVALVAGAGYRYSLVPSFEEVLWRLDAAQRIGARQEVERTLEWLIARYPERADASFRFALAKTANSLGHWPIVAVALGTISDDDPLGAEARVAEGDAWRNLWRADKAEECWRRALCIDPEQRLARQGLLYLYVLQMRRNEWRQRLWELYDRNQFGLNEMLQLHIAGQVVWGASQTMEEMKQYAVSDVASRRALGVYALQTGAVAEAVYHLSSILQHHPDDIETWLQLVSCRLETGSIDEASQLFQQTPEGAQDDDRYWKLHAMLAFAEGRHEDAIADYQQSLRIFPYDGDVHNKLGQALRFAGREDEAKRHAQLARKLAQIQRFCNELHNQGWTMATVRSLAKACEELGLIEEARGWVRLALEHCPQDAELLASKARLEQLPSTSSRNPPPLEQFE